MTNRELIEAHAEKIALLVENIALRVHSAVTLPSEDATYDLKSTLVEFADEIKRQCIEP